MHMKQNIRKITSKWNVVSLCEEAIHRIEIFNSNG